MKRFGWRLAVLLLVSGCEGDGDDPAEPFVGSAVETAKSVVLGCPVFVPTTLTGAIIASGSLAGGAEEDVVTAVFDGAGTATLRIYAGTSDGKFVFSSSLAVTGLAALPFGIVADASGDGRNDIVVCDPGIGATPGKIVLIATNADGSFSASSTLVASAWPVDVESADYDGDGFPEVYVLDSGSRIYRTESGVTDAINLAKAYRYLASGSFSGSANQALAAAVAGSDTVDLLQVSLGSIDIWTFTTLAGAAISGLQTGDFNGDGLSDLAVRVSQNVKALRNDTGVFTLIADCGLGGVIHGFATADISGDGKADVFVCEAKNGADYTCVSYSSASGSLNVPSRLVEGYWPSMRAGQFNGLGAQDLIFSSQYFFKGGDNPEAVHQYDLGDGPSCVAVGDFNGDLKLDLVAFLASSGELSVSLGTGPLAFGAPVKSYVDLWNASRAVAGRFDSDANLDLAVLDGSDLYVLAGNGNGGFAAPQWIGSGADFTTLDVENDGRLEIAYTDPSQNRVRIYANGTTTNVTVTGWPRGIAAGDFNADGLPDLVVARMNAKAVQLLTNGAGFSPGASIALAGQPWAITTGDFNGDGFRDVAVGGSGSGFWLVRGATGATFAAPEAISSGFLDALGANDLDADGRSELIGLDIDLSLVCVYLGNVSTPLQSAKLYPAAWYSSSLTVADADGDGDADVTVGNQALSGADQVLIWQNLSGDFGP